MNKTTYTIGLIIISVSAISFGSGNIVVSNGNSAINISTNTFVEASDVKWQEMVSTGESLLHKKQPKEAIEKYFDPVIEQFSLLSSTNTAQIYCARDSKETLVYLIQVAALHDSGEDKETPEFWGNRFAEKKDGAEVLSQFWAEAFFLKSYALVELGDVRLAKEALKTAVGLSPLHSNYLAELGHIYQLEKNWDMALEAFKASEEAVSFSHPDSKEASLGRAWRGMGYAYIEQGKVDEAKKMYEQCLKLNPNDRSAVAELKYIEGLQDK